MANITVAAPEAKVFKEEGVEWFASIHHGHIHLIMGQIALASINIYHMRHKESGAYCAEGWARTTGKPGVCFGTAGPGYGNMLTGMYQTYLS